MSDFELDAALVSGLTEVVNMSAGLSHTCALHEDGMVSCWGNNRLFQLGNDPSPSLPQEVVWSDPTDM